MLKKIILKVKSSKIVYFQEEYTIYFDARTKGYSDSDDIDLIILPPRGMWAIIGLIIILLFIIVFIILFILIYKKSNRRI